MKKQKPKLAKKTKPLLRPSTESGMAFTEFMRRMIRVKPHEVKSRGT